MACRFVEMQEIYVNLVLHNWQSWLIFLTGLLALIFAIGALSYERPPLTADSAGEAAMRVFERTVRDSCGPGYNVEIVRIDLDKFGSNVDEVPFYSINASVLRDARAVGEFYAISDGSFRIFGIRRDVVDIVGIRLECE